jgi:saccharopine dehydrogenase-like NADP-dependent oxidoreductase
MRILVVGAGRVGSEVIQQLGKNPRIEIYTLDPRDKPPAVEEEIIQQIDYPVDLVSSQIINVLNELKPDLVLVTTCKEDISRKGVEGMELLVESLNKELIEASNYPIISVSRN